MSRISPTACLILLVEFTDHCLTCCNFGSRKTESISKPCSAYARGQVQHFVAMEYYLATLTAACWLFWIILESTNNTCPALLFSSLCITAPDYCTYFSTSHSGCKQTIVELSDSKNYFQSIFSNNSNRCQSLWCPPTAHLPPYRRLRRVRVDNHSVSEPIALNALPDTGLLSDNFWQNSSSIFQRLSTDIKSDALPQTTKEPWPFTPVLLLYSRCSRRSCLFDVAVSWTPAYSLGATAVRDVICF